MASTTRQRARASWKRSSSPCPPTSSPGTRSWRSAWPLRLWVHCWPRWRSSSARSGVRCPDGPGIRLSARRPPPAAAAGARPATATSPIPRRSAVAPDRDAALTSRHMLRVAIFGAGALGGYFGSRLARAEAADVHLIARGAQLDAIRARGLTVRSVDGDFHVELSATDEPAEIGPVDVVFFAVKSYDTESAAARLTPLLGADTGVVSFQNGIDNEEKLAAVIGAAHVMGGAAFV